jgi:putative phosphoesterase
MLCGLLSDTHNNHTNIKTALSRFHSQGVETILHAGDVTSVQTLQLFEGFDLWIAAGNMDKDPGLKSCARSMFGPGRFLNVHKIALANASFYLVHSELHPEWEPALQSGIYRYAVCGHTHAAKDVMIGNTRVINPGSLAGTRYKQPVCAILNLKDDVLQWIRL